MTPERLEYLRNYVVEKLSEAAPDDLFMAINDEATIAWVSTDDHEVVVITLEPGRITVGQ